ncbi:MAG: TIGR03667 family PPOX class F420-dependent oxidoreductase [Acidimicrobiia bacterium]|nr:TIGR03667 family PPOX class F420-dependent oxidoreductase [Acidimicrobiia bacterium]
MFGAHADALVGDAVVVWLTTVRSDGQPQASPVWFVLDQGEFLIYNRPGTPRSRNITVNPRVALNLDSNEGGDVLTIEGTARIVEGPASTEHAAYQQKYGAHIRRLGYTPEQFAEAYPVPIRVHPQRWRTH